MFFQWYADDTQLFMAIKPTSNWKYIAFRLQICLSGMSSWMRPNFLKINQEKKNRAKSPRSKTQNQLLKKTQHQF